MNDITYAVSVDVNNPIIPYNVYVANVLDSSVRYLEITLYQNGDVITLSNTATATASLVTDNVLVDDSVNCTISNNIITVPLEGLQRHGNLDVQVIVTEDTKVLAIPFPIQVRVTPNIAEEAQIDNDSLGSYAEVVREIAAARGDYPDLNDRLDGETDRIDDDISDINTALAAKADAAATLAGYGIADAYTKTDINKIKGKTLYYGITMDTTLDTANANLWLSIFGGTSGDTFKTGLEALKASDYGKVFHIFLICEEVNLVNNNSVRIYRNTESSSIYTVDTTEGYTHTGVVSGNVVCIDYAMDNNTVRGVKVKLNAQAGKQKIRVLITTDETVIIEDKANVEDVEAALSLKANKSDVLFSDNLINWRKQDKPTKETQVTLTWTSGQLIHADGTIGSVSGTKYAVSNAVTVSAGEVYHIDTKMNYANAYFVFTDSSDNVIYVQPTSDTSSTVSSFNELVTVPTGATKLIIAAYSSNSNFSASTVASVDYLDFSLNAVVEPKFVERDGERVDDWLLNASGLPRSVSDYSIIVADVEGGETLKVTGKPWHVNYYCAFYDKDIDFDSELEGGGFTSQDFISGLKGTSTTTDEEFVNIEITVPVNAKKVIVGGTKNFAPHLYVLSGYQIKRKWIGKKWCAVGDSITEKNGKALKNYLDYISEATGIEVVNMGVSGTGYKRQEDTNRAFYQRVSNVPTDCDVVTIFGSFNDGPMIANSLGTATDTGTSTLGGCINTTIDNLYAVFPTVQLGIIAPTPWHSYNPYNHTVPAGYIELLENICKRRSIPFLNLYYESNLRPWDSNFRTLMYSRDNGSGTHPDENGHKLIAPRIEAFLGRLLNKG